MCNNIFLKAIGNIVQEKCNKVILKLQNPSRTYLSFGTAIKPEIDIDEIINELDTELILSVIETVKVIQNEVRSVHPSTDDPNYKLKLDVCGSLLKYIRQLLNVLTTAFKETLTDYRIYVDQLWGCIQSATDRQKAAALIQQFQTKSKKLFDDVVLDSLDPHLDVIETKFYVITQ
jgi:hypothetical protein